MKVEMQQTLNLKYLISTTLGSSSWVFSIRFRLPFWLILTGDWNLSTSVFQACHYQRIRVYLGEKVQTDERSSACLLMY